jgi:hypothetical protein
MKDDKADAKLPATEGPTRNRISATRASEFLGGSVVPNSAQSFTPNNSLSDISDANVRFRTCHCFGPNFPRSPRISKSYNAGPRRRRSNSTAIRMLFSWLTEKGVLAMNPAREVKTERFSRAEGKTPAFVEGEVQKLLGVIERSTHTGLRDRALLGALAYTFARIGAVVNLKVGDYYPSGKRFLLRFKRTVFSVACLRTASTPGARLR